MILRRALGWFGDKFIIFTKLEEEISRLEKKENISQNQSEQNNEEEQTNKLRTPRADI